MSKTFTAKEICERALRAISSFAITDSAADGEHLREAMTWLDLNMAEVAGSQRLFSLIPAKVSLALTNGTGDYDLYTALGADLPLDRVQFPVEAWLVDDADNRTPLDIVTLDEFNQVSNATTNGAPLMIHISRLPTPRLRTFPTPAADDTTTYTIEIDVQTYAPNVAPGGVTGTQPSGSALHGFRQAWQRWLVFRLASDLGSGPIFKLPQTSIDNFDKRALQAKTTLDAFENREHETTPPVTAAWDAVCDPYDDIYPGGDSYSWRGGGVFR